MLARDIMTRDVITVSPEMTVPEVAQVLLDHSISGVPVVSPDGNLLGIVTEGHLIARTARVKTPPILSLLGGLIYLENPARFEEELRKVTAVKVKDLMTQEVISVNEDTPISDISTLMIEKNINRVPVLRHRKLVGIITRADIVRSLLER
ncbi:MAG: CBS domain-containing protein [Syntrophomonadaceae bacterium]|nr:CBS domain-containing protein [Syntrophomonadaceae bacterium]